MRRSIAILIVVATYTSPTTFPPARAQTPKTDDIGDVLQSIGLDRASLEVVPAEGPLSVEAADVVRRVLYRLERIGSRLRGSEVTGALVWELASKGALQRGGVIQIEGRVNQLDRAGPNDASGGESQTLRCSMTVDGSPVSAVVWTGHVPAAWRGVPALNERASVRALVAGVEQASSGGMRLILIADRVAWHPDDQGLVGATIGRRLLGELGVDVGLLDDVRHELPLSREDTVPFYSVLFAMRKSDPDLLIRTARASLAAYVEPWRDTKRPADSDGDVRQRALVAASVIDLAEQGQYSIAPLFLDAEHQVGQLIHLEGVARRAIRIEVPPSAASTIGSSFDQSSERGLSRYFELELFTADSQNLPLVCCVPSLPAGFPLGDDIRERVQVAGIFFKKWRYDSRAPRELGAGPLQFQPTSAPLLVAAEPLWPLPQAVATRTAASWIAGGAFVAAVCVIFLVVWQWSRGDRRFRRRVTAARPMDNAGPRDGP